MRLEANLSQDLLAERARVSTQAVSALERGTRRAPQVQTLALLMDALHLDAAQRAELEAAARASAVARVRRAAVQSALVTQRGTLLPAIPTSFVGRDDDRSHVDALLRPGWCLTIWGSGGTGKTRLALETARLVADRYSGGVWFVELADVLDGADVARAIATTAAIPQRTGHTAIDDLVEGFRDKHALLLLDNAEHLITTVAEIAEQLLRDLPALTILCTSREPLRVAAEHVYPLGSLPIPDRDDPELERSPAVRLFIDRAASAGSQVEKKTELRSVATICEQLDAIPLALELAAARAPLMSPAEIARHLADDRPDRLRLLTQGGRTSSPRHQTLTGVLDWSVTLLSDVERIVLSCLSVWPGRWTLDDATAVACDDAIDRWTAIDAVTGLIQRSLVVATEAPGVARSYRLLQTTRAYALELATAAGTLERCRLLQAERVRDQLVTENAYRTSTSEDLPSAVELSSIRAALRWTITLGNAVDLGASIAIAGERLWGDRGAQLEALDWLCDARDRLPEHAERRVETLITIARLARDLMQYDRAYEAASSAVQLADAGANRELRAEARLWLAISASFMEDRDRGRQLLEEALVLFEEVGATVKQLKVRFELCGVAMLDGRFADARTYALPLPERFRELRMYVWAASAEANVAEIAFGLGNTAEAIKHGKAALRALRQLRSDVNITIATHNLAGYFVAAGDVEQAVGYARESLEIALDHGWETHAANAIGQLAAILAARGDLHEAALLIGFLEQRLRKIGADYRMELERESHRRLRARVEAAFTPVEFEQALYDGAAFDAETAAALALDATATSEAV